ncbi:MAG: 4a-hydroxytetrahydrobiopterin dehydratase [Parachlamydiaceae bacterium]|nr:4a-hydroxytetrahydrobiopterin dehydratase [Parachlamydiaceae bacterium]
MKDVSLNLANQKCIPCSGLTPKLKGKEIQELFKQLKPGWKLEEDRHLEKEYQFPDFAQALKFTNDIGKIAEKEGHHPDIYLSWGKVKLKIWTHKINGLSNSDFILAAKCDEEYPQFSINKEL